MSESPRSWMPREEWDALIYGKGCPLCAEVQSAQPENEYGLTIADLRISRLRLARNQYVKGYCVLICRQHVREPYELAADERRLFFDDMCDAGAALERAFGADKMNFEILGNAVPHLHAHIKPRYYGDPAPSRPIWVDAETVHLTADEYSSRIASIKQHLSTFQPINLPTDQPNNLMTYQPAPNRYDTMRYNRCGRSGVKLPAISLGLWHNFGGVDVYENSRAIALRAFDLGITHFDLANNYGPPPGSAEENFGKMLAQDLMPHRDELIISTKAGYRMWAGPYGEWGSRKYLISSLDQSLKRMGLQYVDIFYHHRPDPDTPLEESMLALDYAVRSGRALYAGISNYPADKTREAAKIMRALGTPLLIHQPVYNMFNRWIEPDLLNALGDEGIGCIPFSPLAQGLLTNRYLHGIAGDSRASKPWGFLKPEGVTDERIAKANKLNEIAQGRGQTLAQMALAWVLRDGRVTTALIGASKVQQVEDCAAAINNLHFSDDELKHIDAILA